jgi:hypothetical protein
LQEILTAGQNLQTTGIKLYRGLNALIQCYSKVDNPSLQKIADFSTEFGTIFHRIQENYENKQARRSLLCCCSYGLSTLFSKRRSQHGYQPVPVSENQVYKDFCNFALRVNASYSGGQYPPSASEDGFKLASFQTM